MSSAVIGLIIFVAFLAIVSALVRAALLPPRGTNSPKDESGDESAQDS